MTGLLLNLRGIYNKPISATAPAFDPATLFASGEDGFWYDPSDTSTMWATTTATIQTVAASAGVTATAGNLVARIDDKSGNGLHATQATLANRPILRQSGSLYYLEFDGAGDSLATASVTKAYAEIGVTVGIELLSRSTASDYIVVFNPAGNRGHFSFYSDNPDNDYKWQAKNVDSTMRVVSSGTTSVPGTNVITGQSDFAVPDMNIYLDGVLKDTQSFGSTGAFNRSSNYTIGSDLNAYIYQLIHVDRVYTGSEQTDAENYVADKTGITI